MKYIRTVGYVIVAYDENADKIDQPMILNYPKSIVKISDSIEELCDRFIVLTKDGNHHFTYPSNFETWLKAGEVEGIYGAIWAKGKCGEPILKSVAKMDNEGRFELL